MTILLAIRDLTVRYGGAAEPAVDGVTLDVVAGERLGIVGESGSGKTTLAGAITKLLPGAAGIEGGSVLFKGRDLLTLPEKELRTIRGSQIGRVPQDPLAALNPVITVGHQLRDVVRAHRRLEPAEEDKAVVGMLAALGMPDIAVKLRAHPYELSGGMRQRVLIAMAMVNSPELLVADEPTTALDSTVQVQILELLRRVGSSMGMSIVLISHDIHVVASICDRVVVMYGGQVVEDGPTLAVLREPRHPYTQLLAQASTESPGNVLGARNMRSRLGEGASTGGCKYRSRCPLVFDACESRPQLVDLGGHMVRCFAVAEGMGTGAGDGAAGGAKGRETI
jgi:peptide/nickel transport system ATP-binding protein